MYSIQAYKCAEMKKKKDWGRKRLDEIINISKFKTENQHHLNVG